MTDGAEKTFTQADIDALTAKHQEEITALNDRHKSEIDRKVDAAIKKAKDEAEKAAKEANMSELEKANAALEDYKVKYQAEADKNALTAQKEETRTLMAELGVDASCLDFVFIPKDKDGTKARTQAFKEYIDKVKKETFEGGVKSTIPGAGNPADDDTALRQSMGLPPKK